MIEGRAKVLNMYIQKNQVKCGRDLVVRLVITTIFCGFWGVYETLNATETTKQLTNTTLVECFTANDFFSGNSNIAIAKAKLKSQNLTFQDVRMALSTRSKDDLTLPENTKKSYRFI